jgi:peroxiredoxin
MKRVKVGDDMSTYSTLKEDGKPFQMAEFKGKVVVLHLWESTQDNNSKEAVAMKEIFDAYGKNEKFVLLGLCFDTKPVTGKAYAEKNGITWQQVYLGGKSNMYQELGLRMFPTILVIGADGKLVARDVQRPQLKPLIDAQLKK